MEPPPAISARSRALTLGRRLGQWLSPYDAAFLLLAGALTFWVARDAFGARIATFSPRADYWEHSAALRALLEDPFHPRHPLVKNDWGSPRFSPHFLIVALFGRAFGWSVLSAMSVLAVVNTLLFTGGIYVFFREYFRDRRAPLFALIVLFCTWPDAPNFSNVYELSVFFAVASYPSTAALALTLWGLWFATRLARSERLRPGLVVLHGLGWAYVYVTHPLTATLAFTAVALLFATEPNLPLRRRLVLLATLPLGLAVAALWPYYPALGMVLGGTASRVKDGLDTGTSYDHPFYEPERILEIVGFSVVALPALVVMLVKRKHLFVPLGAAVMLAVFATGAVLKIPLGHRYLILSVLFLQMGLVWLLLALVPIAPLPAWASRKALRWAAVALVGCFLAGCLVIGVKDASTRFRRTVGSRRASPTLVYAQRVAELAGPEAVVLSHSLLSWPLPTFGLEVVTLHHRDPLVLDSDVRRAAVIRFLGAGVSAEEREGILRRYRVTHVILEGRSGEADAFLEKHSKPRRLPGGSRLYSLRSNG
ncbi:MAG TPA: hypothetical protein VGK73_05550 [Polyangiaceae bacterium]